MSKKRLIKGGVDSFCEAVKNAGNAGMDVVSSKDECIVRHLERAAHVRRR